MSVWQTEVSTWAGLVWLTETRFIHQQSAFTKKSLFVRSIRNEKENFILFGNSHGCLRTCPWKVPCNRSGTARHGPTWPKAVRSRKLLKKNLARECLQPASNSHGTCRYHRSAGLGRTRLFQPWGVSQRGVVGRRRSVSHVVRPRQGPGFEGLGWVPMGSIKARHGPVWSCMGLYISRTPIQDS